MKNISKKLRIKISEFLRLLRSGKLNNDLEVAIEPQNLANEVFEEFTELYQSSIRIDA